MSTVHDPDRALNGWHPGEVAVQAVMHLPPRVSLDAVVNKLPDQHRLFHTTRLHFLPVTTLDSAGRPWSSILASLDGKPGFISSPTETTLTINAHLWDGDPISQNLAELFSGTVERKTHMSGIGIEVSSRRRNKFAGFVADASKSKHDVALKLCINQALGLCPKYIAIREVFPHPSTKPHILYQRLEMCSEERLPQDVISFIHAADTLYIGTSYVAAPENERLYPSHVGTGHRGGRAGFVRVSPEDGRTLVLPNYSGNRLMNSLGNIHVTRLAGLAIPSFNDGSILYVTGMAENLFGTSARELMPSINVLTTITVTGYVFVQDALPVRELPEKKPERSPYSPPVRYLAKEKLHDAAYDDITVSLVQTVVHSDSLFTLTMETSRPIAVSPGQNAVLDLSRFVRVRSHQLLSWTEEQSTENDDCVRTWTVSNPPASGNGCLFSITMRVIPGGLATPLLYQVTQLQGKSFGHEIDLKPLCITLGLRGIGGDLTVPLPLAACDGGRRLLWIAGGIGITPFLSLTRYIVDLAVRAFGHWDVVLVLSAREPDVMLGLLTEALKSEALESLPDNSDLSYVVHLFCPESATPLSLLPSFVTLRTHFGRIDDDGCFFRSVAAKEREPHICGPLPFVRAAMAALNNAGVDVEHVKRERFTY